MHDMPPPELLYSTTDPYEIPLVMPAWARSVPALAERIDDGYALRRGAGLPTDGALPGAWVAEAGQPRRSWDVIYGPMSPAAPIVRESERGCHRCDDRCICPADAQPMWYAPSTGQHACQDPDCTYAHPGGGDA